MRFAVAAVCAVWVVLPFQQTFRTGVDAVRVDVAVIDGPRPVAGLSAADFELRDSGVLQHVESVAMADVPLGIMLALDGSGSVSGSPLVNLKQAASAVAGLLRPGDHAALLTFAQSVNLMCEWTADRQQLVDAIERTRAGGGTALYDAGYAALTMKDPQGGRSLVIVFSDGDDTA
ncbi:MAG: VWA domain-containing protein, partial [Acidobacteriota bacterium]